MSRAEGRRTDGFREDAQGAERRRPQEADGLLPPETDGIPAAPRMGGALRAAASDFYFNSWRLVPANALWGAAFVGLLVVSAASLPVLGIMLTPLLALPFVGVVRLAALITRGEPVSFWDSVRAWRTYVWPALVAGAAFGAAWLVLVTNMIVGLTGNGPAAWGLGTLAAWGILASWTFALVFWPLLVDPGRAGAGRLDIARLAALLVLAFPLRLGAMALIAAAAMLASTVLFAALLTVSVAFVALFACRYVLPAADRFEARWRPSPARGPGL